MSNEEILKVLDGLIQFADEILPQAGPLCFDVGNLNDSLISARKLQRELNKALAVHTSSYTYREDKVNTILDLLSLVEDEFPAKITYELLKMLNEETLDQCGCWAAAVYAQASDNDVEIPEMPNVLKD